MKNIYLKSCLIFIFFITVIACSKEEAAKINVDTVSVSIPNDGTGKGNQITVTANVDWTAAFSKEVGFSLSPSRGTVGTTVITIHASPNFTKETKEADLNFSGNGASAVIKIAQKSLAFSASSELILLDSIASSTTLTITSNTNWKINPAELPAWIKNISPVSGEGNTELVISVPDNSKRLPQEHTLRIEYAGTWTSVLLRQKAAHNNPPTQPTNLYPATSNASLMPMFSWSKSSDPDHDVIKYTAFYSSDGISWQSVPAGEATRVSLSTVSMSLSPNTRYFYKVRADDGFAYGITESDVVEFSTGQTDAYADGGYTVYQESNKANPIKLIFTGDGYLATHYKYGDLFDQNTNEAIEALFSIEPYKTYREYFSVYKVAAYSAETGISDKTKNITKNTVFSSTLTGGTGIKCNYTLVFDYAQKITGLTSSDLNNISVCLVINADKYAGTCYTINNGRSIAMVPVSREPGVTTTFGNVVCHEYGGHGFGRLADEYINYNRAIPEDAKQDLLTWQTYGYFKNVSPYAVESQVPWNVFFNKSDYSHVGIYTGGYLYSLGVTRPEYVSCMVDNRLYFNTQSRYLIVERILKVVGEGELTYDKFYAKDVQKAPVETKIPLRIENFIPLAPPILIMKEQ